MDSLATTPQTPAIPEVPLAVSDQQNTALLDDTLIFLSESTLTNSRSKGSTEIERWEAVLAASTRPGLAKIKQGLNQLGILLADAKSSTHEIAELLATLGAETAKVADEAGADYSGPLTNLSKQLIKSGSTLSR